MPPKNTDPADARSAARPDQPSVIRRFLMWWFSWPASPSVTVNIAVDMTAAQAYLARINAQAGERVSLQHLLCGAVGRTLGAFPMARARIRGHEILAEQAVSVAMPVNLIGHAEGQKRELGMVVVNDAHRLDLRSLAAATRKSVDGERSGKPDNALIRFMLQLGEGLQGPLLHRSLDALDRARLLPRVDQQLRKMAPITTALTNPGAALADAPGVLLRGGSVSIPQRLVHVATLWGITPVQSEVVPVDGIPAVRPMLPVMLVFDHRLMDGVYAGRVLLHFCALLQDPDACFGADGRLQA